MDYSKYDSVHGKLAFTVDEGRVTPAPFEASVGKKKLVLRLQESELFAQLASEFEELRVNLMLNQLRPRDFTSEVVQMLSEYDVPTDLPNDFETSVVNHEGQNSR